MTNEDIQVRLARMEDAAAITRVINAAFRIAESFFIDGERIELESVLGFLRKGNFLLAETGKSVLGCVYVEPGSAGQQDRAYLGLLAVDPACQRSGLGSLLMNAAENYGKSLSCQFMDIRVVNLRADLPAFYKKRGYIETGTSPFPVDVTTKVPCHFIEMSKELS
jgi:predicted N-acetyltransferase YhbS